MTNPWISACSNAFNTCSFQRNWDHRQPIGDIRFVDREGTAQKTRGLLDITSELH